jgi:polar amino acid transport system substrate-binding protein
MDCNGGYLFRLAKPTEKPMKRIVLMGLLLLSVGLWSCGKPPSLSGGQGQPQPLVVGMDMTYPPFEFKNEKGEPDGVDVRMAEELAKKLGRPLQLESYAFDGLIPALQSGKIDLIISGMTADEERRLSIDFSDPYAHTGLAMLVAKDSPIQSIGDLKKPGSRVTAKLGTTGEKWARKNLPGASVSALDGEATCALEVAQGRADAFLYDQLSIYKYCQANAATTRAILEPFVEESWAIGIRKGNDALRAEVNVFLKEFHESGGLARLGDIYLVEEKKMLKAMGQPFILR